MPPYQSIFSMGRDYGAYGTPQQWQNIERSSQDPRFGAEARGLLASRDMGYVDPMTGGYSMRASMPYQSSNLDARYSMPYQAPTSTQSLSGLLAGQQAAAGGDYFSALASGPQNAQAGYVQGPVAGMMVRSQTPEDSFYRMNYGMSKAEWDRAREMQNADYQRQVDNYQNLQRQIQSTPRPRASGMGRSTSAAQSPSSSYKPSSSFSGSNLGQYLGNLGPGAFSGQGLGQFLGDGYSGGYGSSKPQTGGGFQAPPSTSPSRQRGSIKASELASNPSNRYNQKRGFFA